MLVKLVRNNVAYYIDEENLKKAYAEDTNCRTFLLVSEFAIDLRENKILKNRNSIDTVFDTFMYTVNSNEEKQRPLVKSEKVLVDESV